MQARYALIGSGALPGAAWWDEAFAASAAAATPGPEAIVSLGLEFSIAGRSLIGGCHDVEGRLVLLPPE